MIDKTRGNAMITLIWIITAFICGGVPMVMLSGEVAAGLVLENLT